MDLNMQWVFYFSTNPITFYDLNLYLGTCLYPIEYHLK